MRALVLGVLLACTKDAPVTQEASAPAAASSVAAPAPFDTHTAWWDLAQKSKVYTDDRRIDADNRLKLLPLDQRVRVARVLDDMAKLPASAQGFHDAAEKARDAQDRIVDPTVSNTDFSPVFRAISETSLIVLHGLVAKACAEKADPKALAVAIRTAPLPRIPAPGIGKLSDGRNERSLLEQELKTGLGDDKAFQAALKDAPPPAKNQP